MVNLYRMQDQQKLEQLKKISVLMDSKFKGPFGFRFGLDGILGLIPFVGDFFTTAISLYIIGQSALMGCSPAVLLRMGINILFENLLDALPVIGSVFDFVWKANNKNIALLEGHMLNPKGATFESRLMLGLITFVLLSILVGTFALTILVFKKLLELFVLFTS